MRKLLQHSEIVVDTFMFFCVKLTADYLQQLIDLHYLYLVEEDEDAFIEKVKLHYAFIEEHTNEANIGIATILCLVLLVSHIFLLTFPFD